MSTSGVPYAAADVVGPAVGRRRAPSHHQQRVDDIVDEEVVALLRAVAVDRQRLPASARWIIWLITP